jgi:hypothetical protein
MASWNLPGDHRDETAEWAHQIATEHLRRQGCDETCRALGALLTSDLARHALSTGSGPLHLEIEHAEDQVELRVTAAMPGAATGADDKLGLLRRLAASWGHNTTNNRLETWCRFACLAGHPRPCNPKPNA